MRMKQRHLSDEIPTSSMADIAFLLIIYFMVTTTFTATRGLDFRFDANEEPPPLVDLVRSVLVEVRADSSLAVDQRPLELDELLDYLQPILAQNPAKPVIINTDRAAPYAGMVAVLDELRQGEERLGLRDDIVISIPTEREIETFWL